jgi:preprotein translocase subunit Sec63
MSETDGKFAEVQVNLNENEKLKARTEHQTAKKDQRNLGKKSNKIPKRKKRETVVLSGKKTRIGKIEKKKDVFEKDEEEKEEEEEEEEEDLFEILGVSRTASKIEIRKEYLKKAKQYHPDKCDDKDKVS